MNPILLDLGIIQIYWYSITMLLAIFIGAILLYKKARKKEYSEDFLINLIFYGVIFGIIGARVYYVLLEFRYYIKYPIEILEVWNGGLAIHGALIGGAIGIIIYCIKKKVNFLKIFDMAVVSVIIAQVFGRWGNFFNGEAHGTATTKEALQRLLVPNFIIDGMKINGVYYHPTFYYEMLWNLLGFVIMIIIGKKKKLKVGQMTGIYLMWYSFARFFIEIMRTDSLMFGPIKAAQIISVLLFAAGAILVFYRRKDTRLGRLLERSEVNERRV